MQNTAQIRFTMQPDEKARYRQAAQQLGVSVSALLRLSANAMANAVLNGSVLRHLGRAFTEHRMEDNDGNPN